MLLYPERNCFWRVEQGLVQSIAGRKATGQIGKPEPNGMVWACILDDGDVMGHVSRVQSVEQKTQETPIRNPIEVSQTASQNARPPHASQDRGSSFRLSIL